MLWQSSISAQRQARRASMLPENVCPATFIGTDEHVKANLGSRWRC